MVLGRLKAATPTEDAPVIMLEPFFDLVRSKWSEASAHLESLP
jgi:hypothetical protein